MPTISQILEFLDREEALELDSPPDVWPTAGEDEDIYELDWHRLFPSRVLDRGQLEWDLFGDDGWVLPPELLDELRGTSAPDSTERSGPGWDVCAWYQPIHFHGPAWGIFMYDTCVTHVAAELYGRLGRPFLSDALAKALLRAGFAVLFLHEQYHHKTESLGLRLHVVEQIPRYVDYFRRVYVPAAGTDDQIEEGLANADSLHRLSDEPYRRWLGPRLLGAAQDYLRSSFATSPPGYRVASRLLRPADFAALENVLEAQVQEARLVPSRASTNEFALATYLNHSMFTVRQNIWTIVAKGSKPLLPVKPGSIAPLSRRSVEKYLKAQGFVEQNGRGKGSHRVFTKSGADIVVLPQSNDLSPVVLRNTAHALGLRNIEALRNAIRA